MNRYVFKTFKNSTYSRIVQNQKELKKSSENGPHFPFPPSVFTQSVPQSKEISVSNSISFEEGERSLQSLIRNDSGAFRRKEVLEFIREKAHSKREEPNKDIFLKAKGAALAQKEA